MPYKEFKLEDLTKFLSEISIKKEKENGLIRFACSKQGVIDCEKAFYMAVGLTQEEINKHIKYLEETLEDNKIYYFDGLSFTKYSI